MMGRKELHIGPGAASLLLVAVVVSMGVLALMAMMDVRSDVRMTERSEQAVVAQYDASAKAERDLAQLDAVVAQALAGEHDEDASLDELLEDRLPEGMEIEDDIVSWDVEVSGTSVLHCAARVSEDTGVGRVTWVTHCFESMVGAVSMD